MSSYKIPVACIQPRAHDRPDFPVIWPNLLRLINEAADGGAKLVVLPEGTVPAYVLGPAPVRAEEIEVATADLRAVALGRRLVIVYGGVKIANGVTYNAAICIGPDGTELGHAAKQFLWHFDRRWFAPGMTLEPVETPLGTLGLLVCADGRIPTIAATLAERGARALVMPTAWVTSGRDPLALENLQADLMANIRARENGVPFVVANKCGVECGSVAYCGKSAIIAGDGEFVARAGETHEEIISGEIELDASARRPVSATAPAVSATDLPAAVSPRARLAFSAARDANELRRLTTAAEYADCDLLVYRGPLPIEFAPPLPFVDAAESSGPGVHVIARDGVRFAVVDDASISDPRGLVDARLQGLDLFIWQAGSQVDPAWRTRLARTRAAELRAFAIVFESDGDRAFAVDPDGAVLTGTFGAFRLASFVYDRARTQATTVAPTTDVLAGLRVAESIAAGEPVAHGVLAPGSPISTPR